MYWRRRRSEFEAGKGEGNKAELKRLVKSGAVPGVLAYSKGEPAGWCSFGPRETFPVLDRSRILKRVDDLEVWPVVCFFIHRQHRKKGLTVKLLKAAAKVAKERGAKALEGYPIDTKGPYPDTFAFTGLYSSFKKAGFKEVERRSPTRPIMRMLLR